MVASSLQLSSRAPGKPLAKNVLFNDTCHRPGMFPPERFVITVNAAPAEEVPGFRQSKRPAAGLIPILKWPI